MKILLTTDAFYPMINGVVISTNNLYKELKNLGHDVRILALSENGEEYVDGDIYYLKSINVKIYPGAKMLMPFGEGIVKKIIEWGPDIIHSQTEFSTMVTAKHIAKKLDIPHIHTYHTMYADYLKYILKSKLISPKTASLLTKLLLNSLNGVIAPTAKVKNALYNYGVRTETFIVPTGIDVSRFNSPLSEEEKLKLLNKYGLSKEDNVLIYVGRVAYEKNITEIIQMFTKAQNEISNLKFLIVGGGPYLEALKDMVNKSGLSNKIFFTGMVDTSEIYKYYKLGKVFVTASTSETQGLTYIEALSSGIPVVCKYDKCIEGLISEKNGAIYYSEDDFVNAVSNLFNNQDTWINASKNALMKSNEYSSATFANKVSNIYEKIIAKHDGEKLYSSETAI